MRYTEYSANRDLAATARRASPGQARNARPAPFPWPVIIGAVAIVVTVVGVVSAL